MLPANSIETMPAAIIYMSAAITVLVCHHHRICLMRPFSHFLLLTTFSEHIYHLTLVQTLTHNEGLRGQCFFMMSSSHNNDLETYIRYMDYNLTLGGF